MVRTKSVEESGKKWDGAIGRAAEGYRTGVATTTDWAEKAGSEAAESLYGQRLQSAIAERARQKGVQAVSNEQWRSKAVEKGAARIGPGMMAAKADYRKGWSPYQSAMEALVLTPKSADPIQNVKRVEDVVRKMVETKRGARA